MQVRPVGGATGNFHQVRAHLGKRSAERVERVPRTGGW